MEKNSYLEPSQESGKEFYQKFESKKLVMLNLLRFKPIADYSAAPDLNPGQNISGEDA